MDVASYIKEIGRGKDGARDLSRDDAQTLFRAMLAGEISDLQLGAIWIAMRIKSESMDELAGFLAATESSYTHLSAPSNSLPPVILPSYNGARRIPNLVPLLGLLLAREGVPTLVHGVTQDPKRVTTYEIFRAMNLPIATSANDAETQLNQNKLSFFPIDNMAPLLARLIQKRWQIGVRSSAHTIAKMLQPFHGAALRVVSVTHPYYLERMHDFFIAVPDNALLMRGAEGEAIASYKHLPAIEWLHHGQSETLATGFALEGDEFDIPGSREVETTARWIEETMRGQHPIPAPIQKQVEICVDVVKNLQN